jgi:hypothetical protein
MPEAMDKSRGNISTWQVGVQNIWSFFLQETGQSPEDVPIVPTVRLQINHPDPFLFKVGT